ncbi:hypothetical protein [Geothrix sp. PMB-07]|uniref:hypothetical protein n=1 Tax=Geothrix sp. PMB-07 TaxID=3068640 RepID=UPI002740B355|nr:hypothetical protein [Geothrix sp. PMB-07]WLT31017.1 hypothetical protein Q9293_14965 [Geothrix sp. PMB-07]
MKAFAHMSRWFLVLGAASSVGLMAQAPDNGISTAFKLRAGYQVASAKDGLAQHLMGFGLEAGFGLGSGRFTTELGYMIKPGNEYRVDPTTIPHEAGFTLDPSNSVESRKNKVDGLTLRLGYEGALDADWSWRAGIQLGGSKFTHQVIGQTGWLVGTTSQGAAYYTVSAKNALAPSPFAGMTYNLSPSSAVEFGVLLQSFTALDYQHVAGSTPANSKDQIVERGRMLPHFEAAYVFRF